MHSVNANSNSDSDPDFAGTLKKIKRLNRAVRGMQTHIESLIMQTDGLDEVRAKAEAKRLAMERGFTDETDLGLFIWASLSAKLQAGRTASEKEIDMLIPGIWVRFKSEHEQRVKELSDIMKSLTPQQRKVVTAMNRARLLRIERRERNKHVP